MLVPLTIADIIQIRILRQQGELAVSGSDYMRLVRPKGVEPSTCGLGNRCSILLATGAQKDMTILYKLFDFFNYLF
jgi:hypothetical protein